MLSALLFGQGLKAHSVHKEMEMGLNLSGKNPEGNRTSARWKCNVCISEVKFLPKWKKHPLSPQNYSQKHVLGQMGGLGTLPIAAGRPNIT